MDLNMEYYSTCMAYVSELVLCMYGVVLRKVRKYMDYSLTIGVAV